MEKNCNRTNCKGFISSNFKKAVDPRFESTSGNFNEDLFKKSYSFIDEMRRKEISELRESIKKEKDSARRQELFALLNSLSSKESAEKRKLELQKLKGERRKAEKELVAHGKKPFYLKKSDEKKMVLIEKFKKIKERNPDANIDKLLEKRRKRMASKQIVNLPNRN